jgi:hypothetical protein
LATPSGFSTRTFVVARYQRGNKAVTTIVVIRTTPRIRQTNANRWRRMRRKSESDALSLLAI